MATRLKTVHYAFPVLASLVDNTLTNLTQITLYLPESSKTFKSVVAKLTADDTLTAGGVITTKTTNLRLGAASYTSISNVNPISNTAENKSIQIANDYTAHFVSNWSGTSMTCDFQVLLDHTSGTTLDFVNVCVTLEITYEYDDTSTTQVKTVFIPLDMPEGAMATSATTEDTIPALDTYLPESSKTYRNIHVVLQGNQQLGASTTDNTMTLRVGSASITTGNYEAALSSSRFIRYVWNVTSAYPDTSTTQTWQPTSDVGTRNYHMQAYLVVTYEYDESASTSIMNSVMLPMTFAEPMGGTTSSDYIRAKTELWIQEPDTIADVKIAFYYFYTQTADIGGLNFRVGTGSFVAYTDLTSAYCGSSALMCRNDAAFTLARGKNVLTADVYRTDGTDLGYSNTGFWIVNYSSGKAFEGSGSHNKTIFLSYDKHDTAAPFSGTKTLSSTAPSIPESDYFINSAGFEYNIQTSGGIGADVKLFFEAELLSSEIIQTWVTLFKCQINGDDEQGVYLFYFDVVNFFNTHSNNVNPKLVNIETARRIRLKNESSIVYPVFPSFNLLLTYHSIKSLAEDSISGFSGTVNLALHDSETGEKLLETTRSGDGAFSFTWFDDTREVFVSANDGTNVGRSQDTLAVLDS